MAVTRRVAVLGIGVLVVVLMAVLGWQYLRLLRPSVLGQLNPDVVGLLNALPDLDRQNEAIIARLFAHGGLSHADVGPDGVIHDRISVAPNQFIWQPAIIVMPRAGELDLDFSNDGHVKAFDPATGREVWSWRNEHPVVSSVLATAGELVFAGTPVGEAIALHARTGEVLWRFQTGSGIHSNPITYSVNGKQFVAIPTGWGGWVEGYAPEMYGAPRGTALFVFALP